MNSRHPLPQPPVSSKPMTPSKSVVVTQKATKGFDFASFGSRTAAFLLDSIILILPFYLCTMAARLAIGLPDYVSLYQPSFSYSQEIQMVRLVSKSFQFVLGWLYCAILYSSRGQTFGMQVLGIRVVDEQGDSVSFWQGTMRYLCLTVSFLVLGLGIVQMLRSEKSQTWHDERVGTYVVRD